MILSKETYLFIKQLVHEDLQRCQKIQAELPEAPNSEQIEMQLNIRLNQLDNTLLELRNLSHYVGKKIS